jgi:hypothetical protein
MVGNVKKSTRDAVLRGPPATNSRDIFHRINYSYQAAIYLQGLQGLEDARIAAQHATLANATSAPYESESAEGPRGDGCQVENAEVERPDYSRLARASMKATKKLAVHSLVKM